MTVYLSEEPASLLASTLKTCSKFERTFFPIISEAFASEILGKISPQFYMICDVCGILKSFSLNYSVLHLHKGIKIQKNRLIIFVFVLMI